MASGCGRGCGDGGGRGDVKIQQLHTQSKVCMTDLHELFVSL